VVVTYGEKSLSTRHHTPSKGVVRWNEKLDFTFNGCENINVQVKDEKKSGMTMCARSFDITEILDERFQQGEVVMLSHCGRHEAVLSLRVTVSQSRTHSAAGVVPQAGRRSSTAGQGPVPSVTGRTSVSGASVEMHAHNACRSSTGGAPHVESANQITVDRRASQNSKYDIHYSQNLPNIMIASRRTSEMERCVKVHPYFGR